MFDQSLKPSRSTPAHELIVMAVPPVTLIWQMMTGSDQAAIITLIAAGLTNAFFFLLFERTKPAAETLMPIVVLATVATVGRIVFMPFANAKPLAAITIVAGFAFGRLPGYMTGALSVLISNLFFGQGPWTLWQMLAFGLIGWWAGVCGKHHILRRRAVQMVFGFFFAFTSTLLLDLWFLASYVRPVTWPAAIATLAAGFYFNLTHGIATVLFLLPIQGPWLRALKRIALKYGNTPNLE